MHIRHFAPLSIWTTSRLSVIILYYRNRITLTFSNLAQGPTTGNCLFIGYMRKIISIIIAYILLIQPASPYTGDIERIDNRKYFPEVKKLLQEAKESIYVTMYIAVYNPKKPNSPSNQLLDELVRAQKREVAVNVILDQEKISAFRGHYNDPAYFLLKGAGSRVGYDNPYVKAHPKLIIIDQKIVVIGSHNWSNSAIKKNLEATVIIRCPQVARGYIEWFQAIPLFPRYTPPPQAEAPNVYLPYQFLTDRKLGRKLHGNRLKIYLYLLKKWEEEETGRQTFMLDYGELAKSIGWDKYSRQRYRDMINRVLKVFQDKFKIILYKPKYGKPAEINLLDYNDSSKLFNPDPKDCFIIPGAFWEFGWIQRLSSNAVYFYLINLAETKHSIDPKNWWTLNQENLSKRYHIGPRQISKAVRELKQYHLITVRYSEFVDTLKKRLTSSQYLLLPLYSWEWHQQELKRLSGFYGGKKLAQARQWAEVILEENNLEVIEKLINYADQYGESTVKYALDEVAKKQIGNPKRSFPYVEGIILIRAETSHKRAEPH